MTAGEQDADGVSYALGAEVGNDALNALFAASWPDHAWRDFEPILSRSLVWVRAHQGERLIGFVHLAWDGGIHAFLLDPTVHPDWRRRGIGSRLVELAVEAARERGLEWVHVDYESHLAAFYARCGFRPTGAGVIQVSGRSR
jgi:GNAT superfamily N-acetyltransferase